MIYVLGGIFLFLLARKKSTGQALSSTVDNAAFLQLFYEWVSQKEGRRPDNSTIAGNVNIDDAPCSITYNNVTYNNVKSIGGITWTTFKNLAPQYKYDATCENFASLSGHTDSKIWMNIVDYYRQKGLFFSSDPILSSYIGFWYWGGWNQDLVTTDELRQALASSDNPNVVLRNVVDLRIEYFNRLAKANPTYKTALPAWTSAANKYFDLMSPLYNSNNV